MIFQDQHQNVFHMELSGSEGQMSQYVAVAFSPNGRMENSDLYYCTGETFNSGVIKALHVEPFQDEVLPVTCLF